MNSQRMAGRTAFLVSAVVTCILLAIPTSGRAQGRAARVFFVTFETLGQDVPGVVASQINRDLIQRLDATRNLEVTSRVRTRRGAATEQAPEVQANAAIDEGEQRYQAGIGLYVVGDYAGAVASFEEMVRLFETSIAEVRNWNMLVDGLARLAECQLRTGNEEAARENLYRLLIIRPDHPFNAETTGQAFVAMAEEIRADLARYTAAGLVVQASEEGAAVFLDGIDVGAAPVTIDNLQPGEHFVVARDATGRAVGERVVVDRHEGATVNLTFTAPSGEDSQSPEGTNGEPRYLRSLRDEIRQDHIGDTMRLYLEELATRQGVDFVLIGVVMAHGDDYLAQPFLFRAEDGRFAWVDSETFDSELTNVTVNMFSLSQKITAAIREFPERLVTGEPLLREQVPEPALVAQESEPEYTLPSETSIAVSLATLPPEVAPVPPAAPVLEPSQQPGPEPSAVFGTTETLGGNGQPESPPIEQPTAPTEAQIEEPIGREAQPAAMVIPQPAVGVMEPTPTAPPPAIGITPAESTTRVVVTEPVAPDTRITDPVPLDTRSSAGPTSGSYPGPAYPYPPYGYGYPPPGATEQQTPPQGYAYPPYGYAYPPYGYSVPTGQPTQEGGEQPAPTTYPPPYGYPPYGYGYPSGYGYPQAGSQQEGGQAPAGTGYPPPYGYPPYGYGYAPPGSETGGQQPTGAYGYPPYGYGYPPSGYPPSPPQEGSVSPAPGYGVEPQEEASRPAGGYQVPVQGGVEPPGVQERVARTESPPATTGEVRIDQYEQWEEEEGESIFEQWWFWAGSAGVVAIVTTTIVVLASGDAGEGDRGGFTPIVSW